MYLYFKKLDHVFLVMVNAVGRRSEICCCRKKRDALASPKMFWLLTFPGCPVEDIFVCAFEACFAEICDCTFVRTEHCDVIV